MPHTKSPTLLEYYASFRQRLIVLLTGRAHCDGKHWDDTTPQEVLRESLREVFAKHVELAKPFGFHLLTRHAECGNPAHARRARDGFVMDPIDEVEIIYRERGFHWDGSAFFSGERLCACPCSKHNLPTQHQVFDEAIYDVMGNRDVCINIESILLDVRAAMEACDENQPRSEARQYILRAILKLNESVAPVGTDAYIKRQLEMAGVREMR